MNIRKGQRWRRRTGKDRRLVVVMAHFLFPDEIVEYRYAELAPGAKRVQTRQMRKKLFEEDFQYVSFGRDQRVAT